MTGPRSYAPDRLQARHDALTRGEFVWSGDRGKIACRTCGRRGYSGGAWMDACLAGHRPCPVCPATVPTKILRQHLTHRNHP